MTSLLDQENLQPTLPLESFRRIIGYNPFHFWQLTNSDVPLDSKCNSLVYEYSWQNVNAVGRADIRAAIAIAEEKLRSYLHYSPAPHYVEETLSYPRYYDRRSMYAAPIDSDGRRVSLKLAEGYVQALGVEAHTLIGTPSTITYSDSDGDGITDTFTTSALATTVTDTDQIAVYFSSTDRYTGASIGPRWRIAPVKVTISGGNVTIKGPIWLIVKPIKYQGYSTSSKSLVLDPGNVSNPPQPPTNLNYATSVEIYRRYTNGDGTTNATAQALFTWETSPGCDCATVSDSSTDPAAIATSIGRVGLRDSKTGLVTPGTATYDTTSALWASSAWTGCQPPDRVLIRYLAGLPLVNGEMAPAWQQVVAHLALAELPGPLCNCERANREVHYWQTDLARTGGNNDEQYGAISARDLDNPFGTRRGHVFAWRFVQNRYQTRGFRP